MENSFDSVKLLSLCDSVANLERTIKEMIDIDAKRGVENRGLERMSDLIGKMQDALPQVVGDEFVGCARMTLQSQP